MNNKEILAAQQRAFDDLWDQTKKTISFNQEWHTSNGEIGGVVEHQTRRIIMLQGETAKTVDNFNRKVLLLGTHFGTIAVYASQPFGKEVPLAYYASEAFSYAVGDTMGRKIQKSALLKDTPYVAFLNKDFFNWVDNVAQVQLDRGNNVSDGMKTFGLPSRRKKRHDYKSTPKVKNARANGEKQPPTTEKKSNAPSPSTIAYHMTQRRKKQRAQRAA